VCARVEGDGSSRVAAERVRCHDGTHHARLRRRQHVDDGHLNVMVLDLGGGIKAGGVCFIKAGEERVRGVMPPPERHRQRDPQPKHLQTARKQRTSGCGMNLARGTSWPASSATRDSAAPGG
jgi:hypothetical protein